MNYKFCNPFEGDNDKDYVIYVGGEELCGRTFKKSIPVEMKVDGTVIEEEKECVCMCKEHSEYNQNARLISKRDSDLKFQGEMASLGVDSPRSAEDTIFSYLEDDAA